MLKVIIIYFFSFYLPANSSPKDKIISQMKLTNNLSFNFNKQLMIKVKMENVSLNILKKFFVIHNLIKKFSFKWKIFSY